MLHASESISEFIDEQQRGSIISGYVARAVHLTELLKEDPAFDIALDERIALLNRRPTPTVLQTLHDRVIAKGQPIDINFENLVEQMGVQPARYTEAELLDRAAFHHQRSVATAFRTNQRLSVPNERLERYGHVYEVSHLSLIGAGVSFHPDDIDEKYFAKGFDGPVIEPQHNDNLQAFLRRTWLGHGGHSSYSNPAMRPGFERPIRYYSGSYDREMALLADVNTLYDVLSGN